MESILTSAQIILAQLTITLLISQKVQSPFQMDN